MANDQDSNPEKPDNKSGRPTQELAILDEQINAPPANISYWTLFRYATTLDVFLLLLGSLFTIAGGAALPLMTLLIGTLAGNFGAQYAGFVTAIESAHNVAHYSLYFIYLAVGEFIAVAIGMATFSAVGEHVALRIREEYVRALLRQNIAYFDKAGAGEVASRASTDVNLIQEGISEKVALVLMGLGSFVSALVVAFVESWRLALIAMSSIVALIMVMGGVSRIVIKFKTKSIESQGLADNVVEEAVSSIRNVTAFGAQDKIARRYDGFLQQAEHWSFLNRATAGFMMGLTLCIVYAEHALSFWQGSRFLVWRDISLRAVIVVQLAILLGGAYLGQSLPHIHSLATAIAAGTKVFAVIDRESPIDPESDQGTTLDHVEGEIEFRDVGFAYPSRPEVSIFDGLNLILPAGKTTAVAGPSGCGKSTLVGLMELFYKPIAGTVMVDGNDLATLNLRWWRQQVALVSQEPVLFNGSIFENIGHGLIGSVNEHASKEDKLQLIIEAAKTANAHDFITNLPAGYDTQVGDAGRLLSGGQRQRIAIARAVVSNPKILLLDEATSNLDAANEVAVQAAMEKAAHGRTTMIIAHKLSMVHNADKIIVISDGHIVEQGSHFELAQRGGVYADNLRAQNLGAGSSNDDEKLSGAGFSDPTSVTITAPRTASVDKGEFTRVTSLSEKRSLPDGERVAKKEKRISLTELIRFMWSLNKAEKYSMLFGSLCSIINGSNQPLRGIFFAHSILAISWPLSQSDKIRSQSDLWAGMFLMLGLVQLVACTFQGLFFAKSSARLVRRAQNRAFRSILNQGIPYFDKLENSAGSLTSLLSSEAAHIVGISGSTIGAILVFVTTVFGAIGIALGFGWKLSLVGMSVMPPLVVAGFIRFWLIAQFDARTKQTTQAGSFVSSATASIRTVASLTLERVILQKYRDILVSEAMSRLGFIVKSSVAYAFSQSFMFFATALGFWYGGKLVASGEYDILQFFICFTETMFGAQAAGSVLSFAPEVGSGRSAVESFKRIIETPGVDLKSGEKVADIQGNLEFRDVNFHYPERRATVFQGFNLTARAGQFTAIVGESGSGKSTAMALIERFYEPTVGSIHLDGQDISKLSLGEYRQQLALVSQETTLYDGTIRENLLFDQDDIDDDAVEAACKSANIYDFIMSLPDGFNTRIGPKGTSLSGGQRQRVAIARALLREPKILLLDEATSALDSASEEVVEEALKTASKGRTTIAIAHRLSSIQHADIIYVLDSGRMVECGTHSELLTMRGEYWKMVNLQSLESEEPR